MIIATAGHVDHGKTALVKALTGADTDRLPEEKSRGLSIDLGFAYQWLPDKTPLGFVDVPGHEKFIRNMLAGVGGIDLGLLVVAADDGVMPQTREHAAILDLLGIDQCVVAITKIDRVDYDRVLEVQDQVTDLPGIAGHEAVATYPVCAPDHQGIDVLKDELDKRARNISRRPVDGNFRMAIDRAFTLKGIGLVVTGMVRSGAVNIDDTLVLSSGGSQVRVRGIHAHNRVSERARAGERCAINIAGRGINEDAVNRGNWLMHANLYAPTRRIDVNLRVLETEPRSLKHWTPTHLHIGTDHLTARVAVLSGGSVAAGEQGLVQLVLEQDAFVAHGDRFVLRDQSARRTIAGGYVIDPFSPRRGRARSSRIAALRAMDHRAPGEVLGALAETSETGVRLVPFAVSHNLAVHQLDGIIESMSLVRVGRKPQQRVFSADRWQVLSDRIEQAVVKFHNARPDLAGPGLRDIQLALRPYTEICIIEEAASTLVGEKRLGRRGAQFHLPSHQIEDPGHDRILWTRAATNLSPETGSPPSLHQTAEALGIDKRILESSLKNAVKAGEMTLVAKNRYLPTSYLQRLGLAAEELSEKTAAGDFTVAEYCQQTQTGRNFAIDLLEYFDRLGFTQRTGNNRRIKRPATTIFASGDTA